MTRAGRRRSRRTGGVPVFAWEADRWIVELRCHVATHEPGALTIEGLPLAVRAQLESVHGKLDVGYWLLRLVAWRAGVGNAAVPHWARYRVTLTLLNARLAPSLGQALEEWSNACLAAGALQEQ